ncbi:MAG: DUF4832 domain-containing protein [Prevotellaceae bacterium]|jgi:hypothetical protein|nr:DUF4832 domain-containing protein [Prevotellaceae bacterium]
MKKILYLSLFTALIICACSSNDTPIPPPINENLIVNYELDETIFPNPERGWYTHKEWTNTLGIPLSVSELTSLRNTLGLSLALTVYYMEDFVNKELSSELLALIQKNFDALREAGMKSVLRFAYSKSQNATHYDAPENIVLTHINQLKPLFEKNADVIAVLEAGFIGVWGEWYYSNHYGNLGNADYPKRRTIVNALLQALPKERMICLRTPTYKVKLLNTDFNDVLTESDAYNQTGKARLAYHNDCFLADGGDMGTFTGNTDRNYTAADSKYVAMGGETCTTPTTYSECVRAIETMSKYHWSYLNKDYHTGIINDWRQKGCFDEIQRRLGYRFVLEKAEHPEETSAGEKFEVNFTVENVGFAAPYNSRKVEIIFRSKTGKNIAFKQVLKADPRFWFGGEKTEVKESITLPANLASGDYEVLLWLSDPKESLNTRSEYAVRLANKNVWEAETGYNKLFEQKLK